MNSLATAGSDRQAQARASLGEPSWYRWYVLAVLTLVYVFNYVDRQLITILAPYLKADLHITDAQLGLLYGTAFALFYGLFGIPLARLADGWSRVRTLALGLSFWSLMTAMSGLARNFTALGIARIGVGIGESSSTPAAVSILGDYFERARRGTVLGLYSVGVYVGAGVSLMIGGSVVGYWQSHFEAVGRAPFGLSAWQAAFMAVGLPGVLFALLVLLTIREPQRGRLEQRIAQPDPAPFRSALRELGGMIPPWTWINLRTRKAPVQEFVRNVAMLIASILLIAIATKLTNNLLSPGRRAPLGSIMGFQVTSNLVQWLAIGTALYACSSWFQFVRLGDAQAHRLITGSSTFRFLTIAGGFLAFAMNVVNGFVFVYASRYHGFTAAAGLHLGVIAAVAGGIGITVSGYLSDTARRLHANGRIYMVCLTASAFTAASFVQYLTESVSVFYVAYGVATLFVPMWFAPMQATTQDLAVPRLRGTAFAVYSLGPNIFGLGLGPYTAGLISDATGNLRLAILLCVGVLPATLFFLVVAARSLQRDEAAAIDAASATT